MESYKLIQTHINPYEIIQHLYYSPGGAPWDAAGHHKGTTGHHGDTTGTPMDTTGHHGDTTGTPRDATRHHRTTGHKQDTTVHSKPSGDTTGHRLHKQEERSTLMSCTPHTRDNSLALAHACRAQNAHRPPGWDGHGGLTTPNIRSLLLGKL